MFRKIRKGIRRFMNEKIATYKEFFNSPQNRLISGIIMVGTGLGLVVSAFAKAPC